MLTNQMIAAYRVRCRRARTRQIAHALYSPDDANLTIVLFGVFTRGSQLRKLLAAHYRRWRASGLTTRLPRKPNRLVPVD